MLKPTIFREYDIRGIADQDLLSPDIELLGRGIGTYLRRQGVNKLNLGRDCRLSGDRLRGALLKGLLASGCDVVDVGRVPTPLLYYSVFHLHNACEKLGVATRQQAVAKAMVLGLLN